MWEILLFNDVQLPGRLDFKVKLPLVLGLDFLFYHTVSVADLQTKVSGARLPQQDQILSFLHMFSLKSACVGGWRPLQ